MFRKNKIVLLSSFFGNALEFYDFTLYGVFAHLLSNIFFPSSNPSLSMIASWGAFSAAILMRPIGALIFGFLGDLSGRKRALSLSILFMAIPTIIIAFLPTYSDIGIYSPLILILCRLLQGIAMGGEYNGSAIFALEHFNNKRPGLIGGIITSSGAFGALMATFLGSLAIHSGYSFAWRIPFLLGGVLGLLVFCFRFLLQETPSYLQESTSTRRIDRSFKFIFNYTKMFFANFSIGALNGCLAYILFGFSITYLIRYCQVDSSLAMKCNMVGLLFFMFFNPIAGIVFDILGYRRYFYTIVILTSILIIPIFFLLQTSHILGMVVGFMALGVLTGSIAGPSHAFLQNYVSVDIRYRAVALSFSFGMGVFGGATPIILTAILEHYRNPYTPAYLVLIITFGFYCFTKSFLNALVIGKEQNTSIYSTI